MSTTLAGGKLMALYQDFLDRVDRPGWRKFASAMVALGLGFLLAIYSGVFAQQGRIIATGICASLALLLAGYVALTAVPYLARRTSLEWLRVSMDYHITREGWSFVILIFVLAIAGLNTGNNLLYLVLASLLAAILMSGLLSALVLLDVELEILLPDHVFARRPAPAQIHLKNLKKMVPSFSTVLSGAGDEEREAKEKKGWSHRKSKPPLAPARGSDESDRRILRQPLYFPFLPAGKSVARSVELEFPRRGLYRESGFALSTRFPFGFLEKTLQLPASRDLWVYPAVEPTEEFYEILPMLSGEMEAFQRGRGHDLYSIRDLLTTDSARHIDWKASARTRALKVREFTREDERRLQLVLDRRIGPPPAASPTGGASQPLSPSPEELFEAAVEFCACLAWHFHEVDAQLQFVCDTFETPSARAGQIIYDILRFLAAVEPSRDLPATPPAGLASEENVFRIICTAAPRGSVPTALWSRSYLIFFETLRPGRKKGE